MAEETDRRQDAGYMRAKFEQIIETLEALRPLPQLVERINTTLEQISCRVQEHDLTLYGERMETGLVGRVDKIELRLNQVLAACGLIGGAGILWIVSQVLGLIKP